MTSLENYKARLLGRAVGNALGAPVEFMSREKIIIKFGPEGITDYVLAYGRLGAITDDTQMTPFTVEGVLRAFVRWSYRGIASVSSAIEHAYQRWRYTQEHSAHPSAVIMEEDPELCGKLITIPGLFYRRAPGNTCLSSLKDKSRSMSSAAPRNNSKGCGAVIREAPIGLFMKNPLSLRLA